MDKTNSIIKHPKLNKEQYDIKYIELIGLIARGETNVATLARLLGLSREWVYSRVNSNENPNFCRDLFQQEEGLKALKIKQAYEDLKAKDPKAYLERKEPKLNPTNKQSIDVDATIEGNFNLSDYIREVRRNK